MIATVGVPVLVVGEEEFRAWCAPLPPHPGFLAAVMAKIEETGETLLTWQGDGPASFQWMCPGCGSTYTGQLGDQPAGGWDAPRWVNSGTAGKPTLTPSLGCSLWRRDECVGHWWLRDGMLVRA